MADTHLLTKPQLEKRLGVSNVTATKLLAAGAFPNAFRIRRHWRIPLDDLLAFQDQRRAGGPTLLRGPLPEPTTSPEPPMTGGELPPAGWVANRAEPE